VAAGLSSQRASGTSTARRAIHRRAGKRQGRQSARDHRQALEDRPSRGRNQGADRSRPVPTSRPSGVGGVVDASTRAKGDRVFPQADRGFRSVGQGHDHQRAEGRPHPHRSDQRRRLLIAQSAQDGSDASAVGGSLEGPGQAARTLAQRRSGRLQPTECGNDAPSQQGSARLDARDRIGVES